MQSLVPPKFAEAISRIPIEWRNLPDDQLVEKAFGGWEKVTPLDLALRRNFWVQYSVAIIDQEPIPTNALFKGVCSDFAFYTILEKLHRVAFIITEDQTEKQRAEHLLYLSWKNARDIIQAKPGINNKTGLTDLKLRELQFKIFQYLDQRQNGKLIERHHHEINQKTLQVNMTAEEAVKHQTHLTPQQIDQRLAELEQKVALPPAQQAPEILDSVSHAEKQIYTTNRSVIDSKK